MIRSTTFHSHLIRDVDDELEAFINDHEIKRENIILLKPYTATNSEDGWLYHYIKLVYESNDEIIGGIQESGH